MGWILVSNLILVRYFPVVDQAELLRCFELCL